VQDLEHRTEVACPAGVRAATLRALGLDPTQPAQRERLRPDAPIARGAMLPRPGVLRTFEGNATRLYVLDYRLTAAQIDVRTIEGEFALAERRILWLHDGALRESGDGGDSWIDVAPPPTGAPRTLEGARCTMNGCVVGPWVRVGWIAP
jgi:hypothetical protein